MSVTKAVKRRNAKKQPPDRLLLIYSSKLLNVNTTKHAGVKYQISKAPSIAENGNEIEQLNEKVF